MGGRGGRCFPGGASSKEPTCQSGDIRDTGSIPGSGRLPGEGNGSPLQSSCLENPMNRGTWWAIVHGVAESDTTQGLILSKPEEAVPRVREQYPLQPLHSLCLTPDPLNKPSHCLHPWTLTPPSDIPTALHMPSS